MTKPVRLAREAREELHEAARRYGEVRPELRAEFLLAIDKAMQRLVRMARHLGSPPGIDPRSACAGSSYSVSHSRCTSSARQLTPATSR
jgi:hypothetical protein